MSFEELRDEVERLRQFVDAVREIVEGDPDDPHNALEDALERLGQ